jgi:hypothetical protein
MGYALINGKNFSHQDINMNIGGVPIVSISDITITKNRVREFSYGTQPEPVGYGDGKKNAPELSFTMSKKDADSLEMASPGNDVQNLEPFDIPLTADNGVSPRFKILKNVLVQGTEESSDEDTTDIKVAFTALCSHIVNVF